MKILNSLTIVADDLNLLVNPVGSGNFNNLSTNLLNDYLISSESYQGYIDTVINNDNIWYNGETFPFILIPTSKNSAGLYASNSYITINSMNKSTYSVFSINGTTAGSIMFQNNSSFIFDYTKNFGEFIINDSTAAIGEVLMSNNGNIYWDNPGFTQTTYWEGYNDIGGLPNLRSFSATFSFRVATAITGLRYTITWGQTFTSSITSGITSSAGPGVNYVDIYHNLNNTYSVVSFFGFTASQWQYLYPTIGLSGITGTFSYTLTNNRVRLSLTGSLPTSPVQINVIG